MCRYISGWHNGIATNSNIFSTHPSTPPKSDNLAVDIVVVSFSEVPDLVLLLLSSVVREVRNLRLPVDGGGLDSDSAFTVVGVVCSGWLSDTAPSADDTGLTFSEGSFGGVASGVVGIGLLEEDGELRLTLFVRRCVDQSPCMDLFKVLGPCVNVQRLNNTQRSSRTDISISYWSVVVKNFSQCRYCLGERQGEIKFSARRSSFLHVFLFFLPRRRSQRY